MRKKILTIGIIVTTGILGGWRCQPSASSFTLTGTIEQKEGKGVGLFRYSERSMQSLATDTIRNGRFHLSADVDEVSSVVLIIDNRYIGTLILEKGEVKCAVQHDGSYQLKGGKYNTIILGYLSMTSFVEADALFKEGTNGGNIESVRGTDAEWEMLELFLRKEEIRTRYLDSLVHNHLDPVVQVISAVMCELQPDSKKTMAVVHRAAEQLGEENISVRRARFLEQQQNEVITRRQTGMIGEKYTDFVAQTLDGKSVQLEPIVMQNRYTLLQFWASWCGPCRKEIPLLKELNTAYGQKGFAIVSFSMDDNRNNWLKASEKEEIEWINISDLKAFDSPIAKCYPIMGIPANVLIDQSGTIIASNLLGDELAHKIASLPFL